MIHQGNCIDILKTIPSESVNTCITSPPYFGLRNYGHDDQIGLEEDSDQYIKKLVEVFHKVNRILKPEGTLWLNLGDSYYSAPGGGQGKTIHRANRRFTADRIMDKRVSGMHPKNLMGIPWRVALALQADGWILRQDIIWQKPNPMPESVTDRCTKAHEYVFLFSKSEKYYFDQAGIKEPSKESSKKRMSRKWSGNTDRGMPETYKPHSFKHFGETPSDMRNKRSVWTVPTQGFKGAHFATFPLKLIEPMIIAGCPKGGVVMDPFTGAGTTWLVSKQLGRNFIGIELNPEYIKIATARVGEY